MYNMRPSVKEIYTVIKEDVPLTDFSRKFIEDRHYSGTCRSQKPIMTFRLVGPKNHVKGVAIIGQPCGANVERAYGGKGKVIELRRLVTHDNCRKNAGSFFISQIIKYLKTNTEYSTLISYADPNYGHTGSIYKASNFKFLGEEKSSNPQKVRFKGKLYTTREMYQKRITKKFGRCYTPKAKLLQSAVKSGKAKLIKQKKKLIYLYVLNK